MKKSQIVNELMNHKMAIAYTNRYDRERVCDMLEQYNVPWRALKEPDAFYDYPSQGSIGWSEDDEGMTFSDVLFGFSNKSDDMVTIHARQFIEGEE